MIFSVTAAGRIADRSGRHATVACVCLAVGVGSLLLLEQGQWAIGLSLAFGLIGAAPAGIIMSLTAQSRWHRSVARSAWASFFSFYFVIVTAAPPVAGWLSDRTGKPFAAIVFAASLFAATGLGFSAFGPLKRWLAGHASRSELPRTA